MFKKSILTLGSIALMTLTTAGVANAADAENTLLLEVSTGGPVTIELRPDIAPKHVAQIKKLAREKFYDGIIFHRVIDGFMAQTGDPSGTGTGGSNEPDLPAEFSQENYVRGTVGMARTADPNSANSQFFICFTDTGCSFLKGQYTVVGQVTKGMELIDKVAQGEPPAQPDKITKLQVEADIKPSSDGTAAAEAPAAEPETAAEAKEAVKEATAPAAEETAPAADTAPAAGEEPTATDEPTEETPAQ